MHCHLIDTIDAFDAFEPAWTALVDQQDLPSPCLSWDWLHTWWRHYGACLPSRRLAVVTLRNADAVVAAMPAYVDTRGVPGARLRTLKLIGTPQESSDGIEVVVRPGRESHLCGELLQVAMAERVADCARLSNLRVDGPTARALGLLSDRRSVSSVTRSQLPCPYLPISGSWDEYLATRSSNFRQQLSRLSRRFFSRPGSRFDWVTERVALTPEIRTLFDLHGRRFRSKGTRTGFVYSRRGAFHQDVAARFFDRDQLRLFRLRAGHDTVAILYCFEFRGGLYYYQGGIDPEWERDGVGTVLMGQAIKYAFERGLRVFDFMRGHEPYKYRWTQYQHHVARVNVGFTPVGRWLIRLERVYRSIQNVAPMDRPIELKKRP